MIRPEAVPGVAFGTASDGDPRSDTHTRHALASELGIGPEWAWVRQVHGARVVEPAVPGTGDEADALITSDPGLPVAVSIADCLPVAVVADGAVGLAHAGWRGTVAGVVEATVKAMRERGHAPRAAVIGPGIGPCCFEVGDDVAAKMPSAVAATRWGTQSVDLAHVVEQALDGIPVHRVGACTHHDPRFHSYRRDGTASRQFAVAWVPRD